MLVRLAAILVLCALVSVSGCASKDARRRELAAKSRSSAPATRPSGPELLTLEQIEPKPVLSAPRPTTAPSADAPLDALALYADARVKLLENQRFAAITVLEKAIKLDPDSFELRYALGEAYATTVAGTDQAIAAFAEAAKIRPDD